VPFDSRALLDWYERVKRPLPWRFTRDPYALLVSEVMLQQTQAQRVVPYYEAFLARFPDPATLAAAAPGDVLAAWSGLGYNRRALALQAAARHVAAHGWPEDLTELPGVGPYTAAAVGSFAWDRQVAAIDTNVRRVLARYGTAHAQDLIPPGRAAVFNQAMMELGATVCRPRAPRCGECPVRAGCAGRPDERPRRRGAERFEDTDRYHRGRVVAALVAGEPPPAVHERVLAGLERDGLIARAADGTARLPGAA
jgi:A/G-specific adenine glycosylase